MKFILITSLVSMVYVFAMDIYTKMSNRVFSSNEVSYNLVSVEISGEVNVPGVYYIFSGGTLNDAIVQAGGFTNDADMLSIDLNKTITSDTSIYVPSLDEIEKVNINRATKEELLSLNGIGNVIADRIILYRNSNGSFNSIEDIKKVNGIGEVLYSKIENYISVDD